ncbi:MAG: hypothetical protein WBF75_02070, partial [Pseudonocardiaceae bacterium]
GHRPPGLPNPRRDGEVPPTVAVLRSGRPYRVAGRAAVDGHHPWVRENNAEDDQLVTVAHLLARNQCHLSWYQQVLHRREHANHARRITVMPQPRTIPD